MRAAALLPFVLLAAACSDPTGSKRFTARIYELESMFGQMIPIATGPYELENEPGVFCVDTLHWQHLFLKEGSDLEVLSNHVQRCDNGRNRSLGATRTGTWTALPADSVRLTWEAGGIVGNVTSVAHLAGDSLTIGIPVYSEGDPADQMRYIVYRRP